MGLNKYFRNLIENYGIERNVKILEYMNFNDIKNYAINSSFFLQLSFYEGMCMSVVESMQLGLVPVVTNVGEIDNYCKNNFNSNIYKNDRETLENIEKVLDDKEKYISLRKNSINQWKNCKTYSEDIISNCKYFVN